jgi:hypothetical protein
MNTKTQPTITLRQHACIITLALAAVLLAALKCEAQTGIYLFAGSETTITLNPGTYDITAYGAQGGYGENYSGGLGAEMEGKFDFTTATTLTLLVGGSGRVNYGGGGGGGSFVVNGRTPLVVAGGGGGAGQDSGGGSGSTASSGGNSYDGEGGTGGNGGSGGTGGGGGGGYGGDGGAGQGNGGVYYTGFGGSSFLNGGAGGSGGDGGGGSGGFGGGGGGGYGNFYTGGGGGGGGYSGGGGGNFYTGGGGGGSIIDSSAIAAVAEVSGVASPDGSPNGEVIINAVPEPTILGLVAISVLPLLLFRRQR